MDLKVLLFCEGLNEISARAQPWRHVVEISQRMKSIGNDIQIFSDKRGKFGECDEIQGLPIRRIKRKRFLLDTADLVQNMRGEDTDIINWHGSDTWSSFYLARLAKGKFKSVVWTLHSGPVSMSDLRNLTVRELPQLYRYWNNIISSVFPSSIIRKWVDSADLKLTITLSHRLLKHLRIMGIRLNGIRVIPSGVDTKRFKPYNREKARENLGLSKEDPIVLYYGPLSSFRGVDTLLEAAPLIRRKVRSVRLLLLGRGHEANMRIPDRLNGTCVEVKSTLLSEDAIIQYLDAADVVVLPFRFWPQVECPLTLLESMAMEKPVVTTFAGAISELINSRENGVLVPPRNPFVLADVVTKLLGDHELRSHIGANARIYVKDHFDWDIIVKQTLSAFEEALRND